MLVLAAVLAGCALPPPPAEPLPPDPPRSAQSRALEAHYARLEADLLARGLLRTDDGRTLGPPDAATLTETFLRLALHDEYVQRLGRLVPEQTETRLARWEVPVRLGLRFDAGVSPAQQARDRADLERYARRLSRVTGHPIGLASRAEQANFDVLIVHEDTRRAMGPELRRRLPGIGPAELRALTDMPRGTFCLVLAYGRDGSAVYGHALAVIRAEHPPLLRQLCLHEEIAQGLGLANDSPRARPSIFNDDEEFALLTAQDELLLRMLYDPRLRPGMTLAEAAPVAQLIATEIAAGITAGTSPEASPKDSPEAGPAARGGPAPPG